MTAPHGDQLVRDYLIRLQVALAPVTPDRRDEIVGEIASHIAEQRAEAAEETDADVHNLLDRVGDPADLAAAASAGDDLQVAPAATSAGAVEILALILTPLLWPVGVILLWLSPAWSVRDKLIGTLVPPGGYPAIFLLGLPAVLVAGHDAGSMCVSTSDTAGNSSTSCTGVAALPDWEQMLISGALIAGAIVLLVLPVAVGIYLATRLNRTKRAT